MGELTARNLAENAPPDGPSQYSRMIPGSAASALAGRTGQSTKHSGNRSGVANTRLSTQPHSLTNLLFPHPTTDPFTLYKSVAVDLLVITSVWGAQTVSVPDWSLPPYDLPIFGVLVTLFGFTDGIYRHTPNPFPRGIVPAITRSVLLATALIFIADRAALSLASAFATLTSSLCGLLISRRLRQFTYVRRKLDSQSRRVLIVGGGPVARSIAQTLRNDPLHRAIVRGFLDDDLALSPAVLGRIADLDWLARAEFIDEVILAIPTDRARTREAAAAALRNHLDIRAVPDLPPGHWPGASTDFLGDVPIVTLHREPVPSAALLLKRFLDIAGAIVCLLLAAPVMAVVALLIRLESPGPVLYSAKRTGIKGRPFSCFKFRSMVTNADHLKDELRVRNQRQGPIFKIVNDPRITRVGCFIRRYSLDELPQLWNVLRGDMSLVGPRPHPVDEVNHYDLHHYRRLDVKPGITGLWQITARHSPSFDLNMHLDLTYIENWNLRLDLHILLSTVRVLFAPEGS